MARVPLGVGVAGKMTGSRSERRDVGREGITEETSSSYWVGCRGKVSCTGEGREER